MHNRERFVYLFILATGVVLLLGALADPPHGWWRAFLNIIIPILLILVSAWRMTAIRSRR